MSPSLAVSLHCDLLIELLDVHSLIVSCSVCTPIKTGLASVSSLILPSIEVLCIGKRATWRASQVLRRHIPPLLSLLIRLVLELSLLPSPARCSNFLIVDRFARVEVLNQLVHFSDPLVVLLQASNLAIEQIVLLVAHLQVLLEAFHISAQVLILLSQLRIETLLEVQVSLHVVDFAIPKVQFVSLLAIVLFHERHTT